MHRGAVGRLPTVRIRQQRQRVHYVRQSLGIQNSGPAPLVHTQNRLGIVEVRIHSCCRVQKPDPQLLCCALRIPLVTGQEVPQRQRVDIRLHVR